MTIDFSTGFKHQLNKGFRVSTPFKRKEGRGNCFHLQEDGTLVLGRGFAWDGPSYPGSNSQLGMAAFARASAVHDALYRLMTMKILDYKNDRAAADYLMHDLCLEDGMTKGEADFAFSAVRLFGEVHAMPPEERPAELVWPLGSKGDD